MSARSQLNAVGRICYFNGLLPLWRSPLLIAAVFLTPFSFLFFLRVIAPSQLLPFGVVGGLLFTTLFTGNGMLNDCAYLRLERQLQQVFVASPLRPSSYILGMALSEIAFSLPAMVLFFVILELLVPVSAAGLAALVGIVILTWLMASSLGFLVSTFFRQLREIWPIGTLIFSTLSVLPPIFYPIGIIPSGVRWVAFLAPSTFSAQLADRAAGLSGYGALEGLLGNSWVLLGGLAALTLVFSLAAAFLARWREP